MMHQVSMSSSENLAWAVLVVVDGALGKGLVLEAEVLGRERDAKRAAREVSMSVFVLVLLDVFAAVAGSEGRVEVGAEGREMEEKGSSAASSLEVEVCKAF